MNDILVDTDVILDLFLDREPHHSIALHFFSYLDIYSHEIRACTSPVSVANVSYILTKARSREYALRKLRDLRRLLHVAPLDEPMIDSAIRNSHKDFEDDIQYYCAAGNGIGVIVTRNGRDFPSGNVPVLMPEEFITMDSAKRRVDNLSDGE